MLLGGAGGSPARVPLAELRQLPPTLKPEEAFALIGVGRTAGYEMIRRDEIPALRLGGRLLVLTVPLLRLIGVEPDAEEGHEGV